MKIDKEMLKWLIANVGLPTIFCGFLAYLLVVQLDKIEKKVTRCARNQAAMMQKMGVAFVPFDDK